MEKREKSWDQLIAQKGSGMSPPRDDLTFQPIPIATTSLCDLSDLLNWWKFNITLPSIQV